MYRTASGSFHRYTGIDGIGWVITRSPTASTTGLPSSSQAAQSTPASLPPIRPTWTGAYSFAPTNEPEMSVPPLVESIRRSGLTCAITQW